MADPDSEAFVEKILKKLELLPEGLKRFGDVDLETDRLINNAVDEQLKEQKIEEQKIEDQKKEEEKKKAAAAASAAAAPVVQNASNVVSSAAEDPGSKPEAKDDAALAADADQNKPDDKKDKDDKSKDGDSPKISWEGVGNVGLGGASNITSHIPGAQTVVQGADNLLGKAKDAVVQKVQDTAEQVGKSRFGKAMKYSGINAAQWVGKKVKDKYHEWAGNASNSEKNKPEPNPNNVADPPAVVPQHEMNEAAANPPVVQQPVPAPQPQVEANPDPNKKSTPSGP